MKARYGFLYGIVLLSMVVALSGCPKKADVSSTPELKVAEPAPAAAEAPKAEAAPAAEAQPAAATTAMAASAMIERGLPQGRVLVGMSIKHHQPHRAQDDLQIEGQGPVAQVFKIVFHACDHLVDGVGPAAQAVDLGPTRQSGDKRMNTCRGSRLN